MMDCASLILMSKKSGELNSYLARPLEVLYNLFRGLFADEIQKP
jgi:hypothetical protein